MTLVKICGLSTPETLDVALEAGADLVGFVFFPASPRNVSLHQAGELGARVNGRAEKVALTVDADDRLLANIVDVLRPDLLQLHGKETPARVGAIAQRFGLAVMKALPIETEADLGAIPRYLKVADRLLFDARAPRDATRPGGLGKPFDWHLLGGLDLALPFMLSGGLEADNVAEAIRTTRAAAVDVSSGVESAPGVKDPAKIRAFIRAARTSQGASLPVE
ncbi:MAG TPA: phosphoribosylanthranilate isomerase [Xanthobacteraceae bacterium]|nr:phosphoribosylanthranilate isomerase [Xanthobacteraceae bacterium]